MDEHNFKDLYCDMSTGGSEILYATYPASPCFGVSSTLLPRQETVLKNRSL